MINEAKKVFLLFLGLFILIFLIYLGKDFGGGLRNMFVAPKFTEMVSPLEKLSYRAIVTQDNVRKSTWIQKLPSWRLELSTSPKIVISKGEGSKVYIIDTNYKTVQVQDNANLNQYTSESPLSIIKSYQGGNWKKTGDTLWEATLKDGSKIKAEFEPVNKLLKKLTVSKSNNELLTTYLFEYSEVGTVEDTEFDAFAFLNKDNPVVVITPAPTQSQSTIIPKTGANENILYLLTASLLAGFFLKKFVKTKV